MRYVHTSPVFLVQYGFDTNNTLHRREKKPALIVRDQVTYMELHNVEAKGTKLKIAMDSEHGESKASR